ncbi:zinc finger MYM-type protein 1-like [Aphis gossypii]|uniref:zinc finger MYM-type protein 1-like n=1 Tax=Aphis gossypii TaxID=80765 RepID=UPI002158B822|nr:zinc finger MYM-type protein 1-like [Aphis gossypii]
MKTEPKLTTSLNVNTSAITESITDKVKSNPTNLIHLKFSNDPAHWVVNSDLISYFSENIPIQNVDADLTVSARQFGTKTRYFRKEYFSRALGNVLKRVIAVIKFLSSRGLAFRGDSEIFGCPKNGNYLGCLELLSNFDPFLEEHIKKFGNPAHIDQLTIIIRYTTIGRGKVVERFLGFVPIEQHDGKYLFDVLNKMLNDNNIGISKCRSQSYDNASNMSGIYSGVQARFREINKLAEWVPCAAHSLNLVGSVTVECSSPQRWSIILKNIKESVFVVKSLSETRWSARKTQPPTAVNEAKSLVKKLNRLETVLMSIIWNDILQQVNIVNKSLQTPGIEIYTDLNLYNSLLSYFKNMRSAEEFDLFEEKAKIKVSGLSDYSELESRKRKYKVSVYDGSAIDAVDQMSARDKFKIQTFYVIIDKLIVEMEKRKKAYLRLDERFNFLTNDNLKDEEIKIKANNLVEAYKTDLESAFVNEFLIFKSFRESGMSVNEMLIKQINTKMVTSFPNDAFAFGMVNQLFQKHYM